VKLAWIDIDGLDADTVSAVIEEASHVGVNAVVSSAVDRLAIVPPTVRRVLLVDGAGTADVGDADVLLVRDPQRDAVRRLRDAHADKEIGVHVRVDDQASLDVASDWAKTSSWTVIDFKDPTKIPLEIVLAAADAAEGHIVTIVHDLEEAEIVLGVLERGSDGVLMKAEAPGEATSLAQLCQAEALSLPLEELEIDSIAHIGLGERACVDTTTHFAKDEGILVGSYANGMILACSETHPLPYMPTRPFRVNAGALHSYVLGPANRTRYLSELTTGSQILAVDVNGRARRIAVGRSKIETRPLLQINAKSASGRSINLVVQDDWHVRVLGPEGKVLNVTELKAGDKVMGICLDDPRHVGHAVREFLLEK
jgi:3-amino-4-hydroxybenzoic acid synthase